MLQMPLTLPTSCSGSYSYSLLSDEETEAWSCKYSAQGITARIQIQLQSMALTAIPCVVLCVLHCRCFRFSVF